MATTRKSVNPEEIQHFAKDAAQWWDESGPFAPLHKLNPARLRYIRAQLNRHFALDEKSLKPLAGLSLLDIGCGGGLVCEPMARLGAAVTGVDADSAAIAVAKAHAAESGLSINYQVKATEELKTKFDIVLALEIIEHVTDPQEFVKTVSGLLKPGGIVIFSTLNRTPKSFLLGIVAAEYVFEWVSRGTHNWRQFIRPAELARMTRQSGLTVQNTSGLVFNPLKNDFALSAHDLGVNYFLSAFK